MISSLVRVSVLVSLVVALSAHPASAAPIVVEPVTAKAGAIVMPGPFLPAPAAPVPAPVAKPAAKPAPAPEAQPEEFVGFTMFRFLERTIDEMKREDNPDCPARHPPIPGGMVSY